MWARYCLVNRNHGLIGNAGHETKELANEAVKTSNIPQSEIRIQKHEFNYVFGVDYSKCTPLKQTN